jgi:hypothetical protein
VVLLSNIVVFFMIYVIMMTISSSALPGRQQLDDVASFPVLSVCELAHACTRAEIIVQMSIAKPMSHARR